jgi:hypothetical protein
VGVAGGGAEAEMNMVHGDANPSLFVAAGPSDVSRASYCATSDAILGL